MKDLPKTKTGIEIGSKYEKPLPQLTQEEELIQRALLHTSGPDSMWSVLYKMFLSILGVKNERT